MLIFVVALLLVTFRSGLLVLAALETGDVVGGLAGDRDDVVLRVTSVVLTRLSSLSCARVGSSDMGFRASSISKAPVCRAAGFNGGFVDSSR